MVESNKICCLIDPASSSNSYFFKVSVPSEITQPLLHLVTNQHQHITQLPGFKKGPAPLIYVQEYFKTPIINQIKNVSLKFFGISKFLEHVRSQKIVLVGNPELKNIQVDDLGNISYIFEGFVPKEMYMQSWKYLPFKATPRKKYRDIDKQVLSFVQEEEDFGKQHNPENGIQVGDWVYFKAWIISHNNEPIFDQSPASIWLKVGFEDADSECQFLFLGKKKGDSFTTSSSNLQKYFSEESPMSYTYAIKIEDIVPHQAFSFDLFKQYFKIKTHKDLLNKITEVFSFNNDISQRRQIAHDALGLIIRKNHILLPDQAINHARKDIIQDLKFNPDFMVYKMDPDFDYHITNMARRQLMDKVVAESIGYQDNITPNHNDIKAILHISQRPRLKDFLYFPFLKTQLDGQEFPLEHESLYNYCLKEKTVNHIIHHLTKK